MSRQRTPPKEPDDYTDQPIYWFTILDKAVERGDHAAAAEAQRRLKQLGVSVRYGRPASPPLRRAAAMSSTLSVRDVCERFAVGERAVLASIRRGELTPLTCPANRAAGRNGGISRRADEGVRAGPGRPPAATDPPAEANR